MKIAGFVEVEHTADYSYRVWGKSLVELFTQATYGLYALAGLKTTPGNESKREIQLKGIDAESLLVAWLNELLYLHENENMAVNKFDILDLDGGDLHVLFSVVVIQEWHKHIKAVTYNNLSIQKTETGLEATLVLDV